MNSVTLPQHEYQALLDKIKHLEEEIEAVDDMKVVRLERSKKMLEVENERLEEKIEELEGDNELLKMAVEHLKKVEADRAGERELLELMEGMQIGGGQETEVEALKIEVSGLVAARAELEGEVAHWRGRCAWLESELAGATAIIEGHQGKVAAYQVQVATLDNALVGMQWEKKQQQQLMEEMRVEGERLVVVLGAMEVKNALLEEEKKHVAVPVQLATVDLGAVQVVPDKAVTLVDVELAAVEVVPVEEEKEEDVPVVEIPQKRKREEEGEDEDETPGLSHKRRRHNDD